MYISVIIAIHIYNSWICVTFRKIFRKLNEMYYLYPGAQRTERAKLEKMIRVIRATIGREKRGTSRGKKRWEGEKREEGKGGGGETKGRKKKGLSVVRDVLVLRHMESRSALGCSWLLQCVWGSLEFEISRIGARSIHLRDNIFRSKYEYYIISAVDAGFLSPSSPLSRRAANHLPLLPSPSQESL